MPIRVAFTGYLATLSDEGHWSVTATAIGLRRALEGRLNHEFGLGARPDAPSGAYHPNRVVTQAEAAVEPLEGAILEIDVLDEGRRRA